GDDDEFLREVEIGWDRHYVHEAITLAGIQNAEYLLFFFVDRLKVHLVERGIRHDLIESVFSSRQKQTSPLGTEFEQESQDDLALIVKRVEALGGFLKTDDGAVLLAGVKRAA